MGIVNLNKARKAKARADQKARADENAVKFGQSKTARALDKAQSEKSSRDHDSHRRDD